MRNRDNFTRAETLVPQEEATRKYLGTKQGVASAVALVLAVVDVLDYAIAGNDGYIVIGMKRDRTALMLTQTFGTEKVYHTGASLEEVLNRVKESYQNEL